MFSEEDGVHGRQRGLLARPGVATLEAGAGLSLALVIVVSCGLESQFSQVCYFEEVDHFICAKIYCILRKGQVNE